MRVLRTLQAQSENYPVLLNVLSFKKDPHFCISNFMSKGKGGGLEGQNIEGGKK